ncbi:hypothetical protein KM043_018159 [Ampulex compressa]|nr:hypothetical protein KM043_018159 [Ampulex compressa]
MKFSSTRPVQSSNRQRSEAKFDASGEAIEVESDLDEIRKAENAILVSSRDVGPRMTSAEGEARRERRSGRRKDEKRGAAKGRSRREATAASEESSERARRSGSMGKSNGSSSSSHEARAKSNITPVGLHSCCVRRTRPAAS